MVDDSETAQTGGRKEVTQEGGRGCAGCVSQARVSVRAGDGSCTSAVWSGGGVLVERLRSGKTREFKSNRITVGSYCAIYVEHDGSVACGMREGLYVHKH